ncbi:helix-turn-helix domain-containing protein [Nonomuraea phyllanthi]|uniref:Helix-turn-helix domain-containing protein n=1 Tax=Nonomuraea phyllanthi TaxID=2219224 RepID=A0A5C4VXR6_9ACTN|nr:AraC family transcriptional regulator [Nonomuraea phyllanthi]KAB8190683.1 helix-turn-helix domain-containing protein [Nonomuraea phyllanthi]QFY05856.1 helix-turn-helix domain-containing protein [Nonomuraea phyllanthi]
MDHLAALLDGPRARGAFLLRSILHPPWSLRIQDEAPLSLIAQVRGESWIVPDDAEPVRLAPGEVAISRGPEPYTVASDPGLAPQIVIHPGQRCATPDGRSLHDEMDLGVRTWGNDPAGSTVVLTGTYNLEGEVSRRLLEALPPLLTQPGDPVISLLGAEIARDEPGQEAVLDRLLDLLLITVLRSWFAAHASRAPGWYRAMGDPVVGRAMRLMQHNPAHPWTVAALASQAGVSRASLARRFTELVGEPPMAFLTDWRLALAADLLREPDATIGSVARKVGYGSPFALSAAFKRVRGMSPQEYRAG